MKRLFGVLLLACLALFVYAHWGVPALNEGKNVEPQPELDAGKIILLPEPAASAVAVAAQPAPACMEWGEFTGTEIDRASAALAGLNLGDALSRREVEHTIGYWVYLPPRKSKAEMEAKLEELKAQGVADYFVIQDEGRWHNAISLGLFRTHDAAQNFLNLLKSKGVKAAKAGPRSGKLTSTVFVLKNPGRDVADKVAALQKDFPDSELKPAACARAQ